MSLITFYIIAFSIGIIVSIYLPMNSIVANHVGSTKMATMAFFFIAFATTFLFYCLTEERHLLKNIFSAPLYLYASGIVGAFVVIGVTFMIPKLGAAPLFILMISGQIIMSMFISHFGVLESPVSSINISKIIGVCLMLGGSYLAVNG